MCCVELSADTSLGRNIRWFLQGPYSSCRQHTGRMHKILLFLDSDGKKKIVNVIGRVLVVCQIFLLECEWCHLSASCDSWLGRMCFSPYNYLWKLSVFSLTLSTLRIKESENILLFWPAETYVDWNWLFIESEYYLHFTCGYVRIFSGIYHLSNSI